MEWDFLLTPRAKINLFEKETTNCDYPVTA